MRASCWLRHPCHPRGNGDGVSSGSGGGPTGHMTGGRDLLRGNGAARIDAKLQHRISGVGLWVQTRDFENNGQLARQKPGNSTRAPGIRGWPWVSPAEYRESGEKFVFVPGRRWKGAKPSNGYPVSPSGRKRWGEVQPGRCRACLGGGWIKYSYTKGREGDPERLAWRGSRGFPNDFAHNTFIPPPFGLKPGTPMHRQ